MPGKLYLGNLAYRASKGDLHDLFSRRGADAIGQFNDTELTGLTGRSIKANETPSGVNQAFRARVAAKAGADRWSHEDDIRSVCALI